MATTIRVNAREVANMVHDQGVQAELKRRGNQVLSAAQASAPVLSGAYRDGLHVEDFGDGVRVIGSTDHDIYVEADTGNLARALDSAGGS